MVDEGNVNDRRARAEGGAINRRKVGPGERCLAWLGGWSGFSGRGCVRASISAFIPCCSVWWAARWWRRRAERRLLTIETYIQPAGEQDGMVT